MHLDKSERLLREAQRLARLGSWEWDVASDTVVWSDELYHIYGVTPGSFRATYEGFLERLHPDDRERVREIVSRAYRTGQPFEYDHRVVSPDGTVRVLHSRGRVETDDSGRVVRMVGTGQDITEPKRTADALLASQRRYRALFEQSLAGVYCTTPAGRILEANEALARMLGYASTHDLQGVTAWDLYVTRGDREEFLEALRSQRVVRERACRMRRKDGAVVYVLNSAALLDEPEADGPVIQGVLMDVTERHRAEVLARGQNGILEMVARGSPLGQILNAITRLIEEESQGSLSSILLVDTDGRHLRHAAAASLPPAYLSAVDRVPIEANTGSCGSAASQRETVVVTDIESDPRWSPWREVALSNGLRACWSTPIFSPGGDLFGTFAMYYREPRGPTAADRTLVEVATYLASVALESICGREALESSTQQLRELAKRLQEIREEERARIAREIHDELGQSLTALKMDLSWVRKRLGGLAAPEVSERLSQSLGLVGETVNTVRRIATDLRPSILDDLGLEAAVEWQAREFEGRTGIRCAVRSRLRVPRLQRDVATAAFRILQEALTNVVRHARARKVSVLLARQKSDLVLEVADDGRGIPPEAVSSSRAIGLLGMRERATVLGGRVTVEGAPGQGTTVRVRVPLTGRSPEPRAQAQRNPKQRDAEVTIRVVVVDDHAVVREGLKRILSEDPRVTVVGEAGDDVAALTAVERQHPDAVITDISMPGRGGLELLHELGRHHPGLPVLVLSIHGEDELAVRAIKAGAAGYLTKDSAPEELLHAVLRVAVGGRYLSPGVAERLAFRLDPRVAEALHQRLSDREYQVLTKLAEGRSVGQIAEELALSPKTISTYRIRLLEKLGLGSNAELISYALRHRLVP